MINATAISHATPTQMHRYRERQDRLRRMGILPPLPEPQPPQEAGEPDPAPAAPPAPVVVTVEFVVTPEDDGEPRPVTSKSILREVCEKHSITRALLIGSNRQKPVVIARHELFFRLYNERGMSLPEIGRFLGGFDHTTVLNGIKRHTYRANGGEDRRNTCGTWTPERRQLAEEMHEKGATFQAIAEALGGITRKGVSTAFSRWRDEAASARSQRILWQQQQGARAA